MKHRKSKIKLEHSLIKDLKKVLIKLSQVEGVTAIIPGRISPSKRVKSLYLTVQYATKDGLKLLAKGDGIQEVFVITSHPDKLVDFVEEL